MPYNYAYIGTDHRPDKAREFLDNPPKLIAVDVETVSLTDKSLVGIGLAPNPNEGYYFPIWPEISPYIVDVLRLLGRPDITKVLFNSLYDLTILADYGIDYTNTIDVQIMGYLLGLRGTLKLLADRLIGMSIEDMSEVLGRKKDTRELAYEVLARKCINDVRATYRLYERLKPEVDWHYLQSELALIPILVKMSRRGLRLDPEAVRRMYRQYVDELTFYRSIAEREGFNPASTQQVGYILGLRGNFLPVRRKNGKYRTQTGEEFLTKLNDPLAALVLNFRHAQHTVSHYLKPYLATPRAYTTFHLGAQTGRLASKERNLQNIPVDVRVIFLPDNGVFTSADYSQQELRTLAYISGDTAMQGVYERGEDLHLFTASGLYGKPKECISTHERRLAKNGTFAMVYGGDDTTIMNTVGINEPSRARELREAWFRLFPDAGKWIQEVQEQGLRDRRVKTLGGRWLYLPSLGEESDEDVKRKAVDYPIQGSAAEITKAAMRKCSDMEMALQLHDELLFDGHVSLEELQARGIEEVGPFRTPLDVEYKPHWA